MTTHRSGAAARDKRAVWEGIKKKTATGLTKSDLMKRPSDGQIISKAKHQHGLKIMRMLKREGEWVKFQKQWPAGSRKRSKSRGGKKTKRSTSKAGRSKSRKSR